jgi:hypothetical protein
LIHVEDDVVVSHEDTTKDDHSIEVGKATLNTHVASSWDTDVGSLDQVRFDGNFINQIIRELEGKALSEFNIIARSDSVAEVS